MQSLFCNGAVCLLLLLFASSFAQAQSYQSLGGIETDNPEIAERYKEFVRQARKASLREIKTKPERVLKELIEGRYQSNLNRIDNQHFILNKELDDYLSELKGKLSASNSEWPFDKVEIVVTKYTWPNAFSVGDGTIALNLGLLLELQSEEQLAFVLSHEVAHFFLHHSEEEFLRKYYSTEGSEFRAKLKEIKSSRYYQVSQLKPLLKANIYAERHHRREQEYSADSLGMLLFLNAGYKLSAAEEVLEILDGLNEAKRSSLDVYKLLDIDTLTYPKPSLQIKDQHRQDILHDDSVKTHPDCVDRAKKIAKFHSKRHSSVITPDSTGFNNFIDLINQEVLHSLVYFEEHDKALILVLQRYENGEATRIDHNAIVILLSELLTARKKHRISSLVSRPDKYDSDPAIDLAEIAHRLRFKTMSTAFLKFSLEAYEASNKGEEVTYALLMTAYHAKEQDLFEEMKTTYLTNFPSSDLYRDVKYMNLN